MMDNLVEIELDSRAVEFIEEALTHATRVARWETKQEEMANGTVSTTHVPHDVRQDSLAHHLLKREDLAAGSIVTCVPRGVPQEALYRFREGMKLKAALNAGEDLGEGPQELRSVPTADTYTWLLCVVQEHLRGGPDKVCMFDSVIAFRGDAWVAKLDPQPHVFQNQVYFALFHQDAESGERVGSAIGHAKNAWLSYGVMSSLAANSGLDPKGGVISHDILEMLAQTAERIVVGAYDGESYLIWSKPAS